MHATRGALLLEHNNARHRDLYWSDNRDGDGANRLGEALMLVRDALAPPSLTAAHTSESRVAPESAGSGGNGAAAATAAAAPPAKRLKPGADAPRAAAPLRYVPADLVRDASDEREWRALIKSAALAVNEAQRAWREHAASAARSSPSRTSAESYGGIEWRNTFVTPPLEPSLSHSGKLAVRRAQSDFSAALLSPALVVLDNAVVDLHANVTKEVSCGARHQTNAALLGTLIRRHACATGINNVWSQRR